MATAEWISPDSVRARLQTHRVVPALRLMSEFMAQEIPVSEIYREKPTHENAWQAYVSLFSEYKLPEFAATVARSGQYSDAATIYAYVLHEPRSYVPDPESNDRLDSLLISDTYVQLAISQRMQGRHADALNSLEEADTHLKVYCKNKNASAEQIDTMLSRNLELLAAKIDLYRTADRSKQEKFALNTLDGKSLRSSALIMLDISNTENQSPALKHSTARLYRQLALLSEQNGNIEEADLYYDNALLFAGDIQITNEPINMWIGLDEHKRLLAMIQEASATTLFNHDQNQVDVSLERLGSASQIFNELGDVRGIGNVLIAYARIYGKLEMTGLAEAYYKQAQAHGKKNGDIEIETLAGTELATLVKS